MATAPALRGADGARGGRVAEELGLQEMLCWLPAPLLGLCSVCTYDSGRQFRNYFSRNDLIAIDAVFECFSENPSVLQSVDKKKEI